MELRVKHLALEAFHFQEQQIVYKVNQFRCKYMSALPGHILGPLHIDTLKKISNWVFGSLGGQIRRELDATWGSLTRSAMHFPTGVIGRS